MNRFTLKYTFKPEDKTIWIVIIIYLVTAICLLINPLVKDITSIYYVDYFFGKYAFIVYITISLITFLGLVYDSSYRGLVLLISSQNFLMVTTMGIIVTILKGKYIGGQIPAGGISFILVDEIARLFLFLSFTFEISQKWKKLINSIIKI